MSRRFFSRPTRADLVADAAFVGWALFYGVLGALIWRGLLALGFPTWLAPFVLAGSLWAIFDRVQAARRRRARRRAQDGPS